MSDPFRSLTRHQTYYIPSADLFFLLGHVQFRVHRYFFERESAFFRGKLTMPMSPGSTRQGSSDADPLVLENVRPEDFERFLWVFYNPRYSLYDAKVDDWSIILSLSHRWGFAEVKSLAVRELEKKEFCSIDRIVFYQANDVDRNLLIPHFAKVCSRENPLTLAEGIKLGMETTLVIASAREYIRAIPNRSGGRTPTSPTVEGEELYDMIRELFNIPRVRKADEKPTSSSGGLLERVDFKTTRPQAPPLPPTPPQSQYEGMRPLSPPPPPSPQKRPPAPESPTPSPKPKLKPEVPASQTAPNPPPPTVPPKTESSIPPLKEEPLTVSTVVPSAAASSVKPPDTPSTPSKTSAAQRKALRREKLKQQKLKEKEDSTPDPSPLPPTAQANELPGSLRKASSESAEGKKGGKGKEKEVVEPAVEEPKAEEVKVEEPKVEEAKVEEPQIEEVQVEEPKVEVKIEEEPFKMEVRAPTPVQEAAADVEKAKEGDAKVEEPKEELKTEEVEVKDEKQVDEVVDEPKVENKPEEPKFELKVEEVKTEEVTEDTLKGTEDAKVDAASEETAKGEEVKVEETVEVKDEVKPAEEAKLEEPAKDEVKADATVPPQDPASEPKSEVLTPEQPVYARSEAADSTDEGFTTPQAMRSRASSFGRWGESDAEDWADADDGVKASHSDIESSAVVEPVAADVDGDAPKTPTLQKAELEPPATESEVVTPVATEQAAVPELEKVATDILEPTKVEEPAPVPDVIEEKAKEVDAISEPPLVQPNGDAEVPEVKEPAPVEELKVEEPSKTEPAALPTPVEPTPEPLKSENTEPDTKPADGEGTENQPTAAEPASQAGDNDQADTPKEDGLDAKARKALKKAAKKKAKKAKDAAEAAEGEAEPEKASVEASSKEEKKKAKQAKKLEEEARKSLEEAKKKAEEEAEDNKPLKPLIDPSSRPPTPVSKQPPPPPLKTAISGGGTGSSNAGPSPATSKKNGPWGNGNSRPASPLVDRSSAAAPQRLPLAARLASGTKPQASSNNRGPVSPAKKEESTTGAFGSLFKWGN